jgi:hypothetical protein
MSRGIGKTQQAILDALAEDTEHDGCLTTAELAERVGVGDGQVRRAVYSLEQRHLVVLDRGPGDWKGAGSYGPLVRRVTTWTSRSGERREVVSDLPVALTVRQGELLPGRGPYRYRAREDTEFVRIGMPVGIVLYVSLPENAPSDGCDGMTPGRGSRSL